MRKGPKQDCDLDASCLCQAYNVVEVLYMPFMPLRPTIITDSRHRAIRSVKYSVLRFTICFGSIRLSENKQMLRNSVPANPTLGNVL